MMRKILLGLVIAITVVGSAFGQLPDRLKSPGNVFAFGTFKGDTLFNDSASFFTIDDTLSVTKAIGIGTSVTNALLDVRGAAIFNEGSIDADFRIESDVDANMFFVDGSANAVGIGTNTPGGRLEIHGIDELVGNFSLEVHGSSGSNNSFFVSNLGTVSIGTIPQATTFVIRGDGTGVGNLILMENSAGTDVITIKDNGTMGIKTVPQAGFNFTVDGTSSNGVLVAIGSAQKAAMFTEGTGEGVLSLIDVTAKIRFTAKSGAISFINNAGNLGIGTTGATARLEIHGSTNTSASNALEVHSLSGTSNSLIVVDDGNVGIGTSTPNTLLDVQGGQTWNVTNVAAATYDLLITDHIVQIDFTTTAAHTSFTIPTAQTVAGRTFIVMDADGNAGTNNITIDTEGGQLINGSATNLINADFGFRKLYCDGTDWFIIGNE